MERSGATPNIYDHFIAHGINFDHAIGEDPLCCPARANLLTGLHTHNNRVTANNALLFDPSMHVGKQLQGAGYSTMFIGKYMNRDSDLTPERWLEHEAGWTNMDVISGINGAFYHYTLHTKTGEFAVKKLHSTQMVADRAVMHLRETPAATPVFAVLSIFDLHGPNVPMPQFVGDPRCADMPPWNPPNYNEADVSDKPTYVQELPLQPYPDGWPMVTYCEEMLGVDHAVGQVIDELTADGRLDNTLLLFTADNGMTWGQHRLGQQKNTPYSTPVPLYMSWPAAGWGTSPASIPEIVSNIDLAPTFCELGGCTLGPYAFGQTVPDGVSLVGLANGDVTSLGRQQVLEESYGVGSGWAGLRTTALYDAAHRWHYVEYFDGERELYDLMADPYELENLAARPESLAVLDALHIRLAAMRMEGIGSGTGSITIAEDSLPDGGVDHAFHGDLGDFTLDDDLDATLPNQMTFTNLQPGPYTVTRAAAAPWVLAGIECDGVAMTDGFGKMTVYLHPQEAIRCTYVDAQRQPDLSVSLRRTGPYKTDNFYQSTPVKQQTVRRSHVRVGATYDYWVRIGNDSLASDSITVLGTAEGPATSTVTFLSGAVDVTSQVTAGTWSPYVIAGGVATLKVRITIGSGTPARSVFRVTVRGESSSDPARVDLVRIVAAL